MRRLTWERTKSRYLNGLSFALNYGRDNVIAHVSTVQTIDGIKYYWYGLGRNTAATPHLRAEDCKAECMAFAKTKLGELKERFDKVDAK